MLREGRPRFPVRAGRAHARLLGTRRQDSLLASYDWFSRRIFLECNVASGDGPVALSVVRFGPWARGQEAKAQDLALAFYRGPRLLRRYSTLDIAGRPSNVSASVSHYTVIDSVIGYRWVDGNRYRFDVRRTDGGFWNGS